MRVMLLTIDSANTVWELLNELNYTFNDPYTTTEGLHKTDITNEEGVCVAFVEEFPQEVADEGHAYSLGYWHGLNKIEGENPFATHREEWKEYEEGWNEGLNGSKEEEING